MAPMRQEQWMPRIAGPVILATSLTWLLLTLGASPLAARDIRLGITGQDNREHTRVRHVPSLGRLDVAVHLQGD